MQEANMDRRMGIRIDDELVATAQLRTDVAPRTSIAVWNALPITGSLMHCTSSGECVFFGVNVPLEIDLRENAKASDTLTSDHAVVHGAPLIASSNRPAC